MAGLSWLKFWANAHESPKTEALSDSEFRLWTRILCLGARSPEPGVVFVVPGVGIDPDVLARGARCRNGDGREMLRRLEQVGLIQIRTTGEIQIHDWCEWNGRPPSKSPEARRLQSRKDRARRKIAGSATERKRQTEVEVEVEEEVVSTHSPPIPSRSDFEAEAERPVPFPVAHPGGEIDLVAALRSRVQAAIAHTGILPVTTTPAEVPKVKAELAAQIRRLGLDVAVASCVEAARELHGRKGRWPTTLRYFLGRLTEAAGLDIVDHEYERHKALAAKQKADYEAQLPKQEVA